MIDLTKINTHFFPHIDFLSAISQMDMGYSPGWMDGQINYCRDGVRKQWKYPASCRLDLHPSFLSHERSLIFLGGSL